MNTPLLRKLLCAPVALSLVTLPLSPAVASAPPAADDEDPDDDDGDYAFDTPQPAGDDEVTDDDSEGGDDESEVDEVDEVDDEDSDELSEDEAGDALEAVLEDDDDDYDDDDDWLNDDEPKIAGRSGDKVGKQLLIAGGATTAVGAGFIGVAFVVTDCNYNNSRQCRYHDERDLLVPMALATAGIGVMLMTAGAILYTRHKKWSRTPKADRGEFTVAPTYLPGGGAGIGAVGRF